MNRLSLAPRLLALLLLAASSSLPARAAVDPAGGFGEGPIAGTLTIQVIDELTGAPVADAYCQVGMNPGDPFPGNGARTNGAGVVSFAHPSLLGPQVVTAGKEGFAYFTIYGVDAREMILPIREQGASLTRPTYEGQVTGYSITTNDGYFDLSLVWRTFFVRELVSFAGDLTGGSFDRFAPTVGETFPLIGLQPVPGAIHMPFQIEFIFIPVSREPYVIYVEDQSVTDISAVYGRIATMTLLDALAAPKPDFLALIRGFDIRKFALVEGIDVNGSGEQDLPLTIGEGAPIRLRLEETAPEMEILAVGIADLDGLSGFGRLMPCGFGGSRGGVDTLLSLPTLGTGAPGSPDYIAGAFQSDTLEGLASTAVFDRGGFAQGDTAEATAFFAVPAVSLSGDRFTWTSTANPPFALYPDVHRAAIALVTTIPDTNAWAEPEDTLDIPTPLWSFVLPGADTSFVLPCLGTEIASPIVDPAGTPDQDRLDWSMTAIRLGLAPTFDYDDWDLVDLGLYGTHMASNTEKFVAPPGTPFTDVAAASLPIEGRLGAPIPNPFRGETRIRFALPGPAEGADLAVYDIAGRRVRELTPGRGSGAGGGEATWDGRDERGRPVPSGIYLFRLDTGGEVFTRKVVKTK